jgi:hypothetical protein
MAAILVPAINAFQPPCASKTMPHIMFAVCAEYRRKPAKAHRNLFCWRGRKLK